LPHYWVSIQIAIASATFVAVLLAFAAAYARAIGGVTHEPVTNPRNELEVL
jgi:hypothetical protein